MNSRTKMLNIVILTLFGWLILSGPVLATGSDPWYWLAPAKVQATGQKDCWSTETGWNDDVPCAGTGQDGEYQMGVKPSPLIGRFKDNRNGTVRDMLTGLIWLKDAFCFEINSDSAGTTWKEALDAANNLAAGQCGLTDNSKPGDWRLPNINELLSLNNFEFYPFTLSNSKGDDQWEEDDPFSNVKTYYYWSSSTDQGLETAFVWIHHFSDWFNKVSLGYVTDRWGGTQPNMAPMAVWPVRGGK